MITLERRGTFLLIIDEAKSFSRPEWTYVGSDVSPCCMSHKSIQRGNHCTFSYRGRLRPSKIIVILPKGRAVVDNTSSLFTGVIDQAQHHRAERRRRHSSWDYPHGRRRHRYPREPIASAFTRKNGCRPDPDTGQRYSSPPCAVVVVVNPGRPIVVEGLADQVAHTTCSWNTPAKVARDVAL